MVDATLARLRLLVSEDRGVNTADLMGNAALAVAALIVIWGSLQALGIDLFAWIRAELLRGS